MENVEFLKDKRILITGAGGTIGSGLARRLINEVSERLYLLDHSETSLFNIVNELNNKKVVPIIADITDVTHMQYLLKRLKVDVIFHTAAYKHVRLMEKNAVECIRNNVFGTLTLLNEIKYTNIKFIFISTDKAVEPTSIYGVSKAIGEDLTLAFDQYVIRFGNIWGSSGSVVPIFEKLIFNNKPVVIRGKNVRRFFIEQEKAMDLIFKVAKIGTPGAIYILKARELYIKDIAEKIFNKYNKLIDIIYEPLLPPEKEFEKLYASYEKPVKAFDDVLKIVKKPIKNILYTTDYDIFRIVFFNLDSVKLRNFLRTYYPNLIADEGEMNES